MTNVAVVLSSQVTGKDLLNLIIESAQQAFGDIVVKLMTQSGYLPDLKRKELIGSKCIITFSLNSEHKVKSFWSDSGYKIKKENGVFNMMLGTALGGDYAYNLVEFNFFTEYRDGNGYQKTIDIDIDDTKYTSLHDRFEEFLLVLYSKLSPGGEVQQSDLSRRVGPL